MPRTPARPVRWAAAALAGLAAGCGPPPTGTVSGTVTVGGQPVPTGLITFSSEVGKKDSYPAAVLNGKYTTGPIPVGATKVTVIPRQANPAAAAPGGKEGLGGLGPGDTAPARRGAPRAAEVAVPPRYAGVGTSGLAYDVGAGEQTKDFDLVP